MKSFQTLYNLYETLSQNSSTENIALGKQLINDTHRYLLQNYFANETSYSILTQGGATYTLTASLSAGDISATLSSAWTGNTIPIYVTFSSGEARSVQFINGSTAISWDAPLTDSATDTITVGGQQYYPLPPNFSQMKSLTIRTGDLQWTPTEILTTQEWNQLNVFPYYAEIPNNFFIYPGGDHGGQVGIWPIPSSTGQVITFRYKFRVPDLSLDDYTTPGSISVTTKDTAVSATGSSFIQTTNFQNESRWLQIAQPSGDNLWYQISQVSSPTALTLYQPYQGITVTNATAGTYTIGQMPIIAEDFHDLLVYRPLYVYFSTVGNNPDKAKEFLALYENGLKLLAEYSGSNTLDVNLGRKPQTLNPNLFPQNIGSTP